jgi:hypothetical protein
MFMLRELEIDKDMGMDIGHGQGNKYQTKCAPICASKTTLNGLSGVKPQPYCMLEWRIPSAGPSAEINY